MVSRPQHCFMVGHHCYSYVVLALFTDRQTNDVFLVVLRSYFCESKQCCMMSAIIDHTWAHLTHIVTVYRCMLWHSVYTGRRFTVLTRRLNCRDFVMSCTLFYVINFVMLLKCIFNQSLESYKHLGLKDISLSLVFKSLASVWCQLCPCPCAIKSLTSVLAFLTLVFLPLNFPCPLDLCPSPGPRHLCSCPRTWDKSLPFRLVPFPLVLDTCVLGLALKTWGLDFITGVNCYSGVLLSCVLMLRYFFWHF